MWAMFIVGVYCRIDCSTTSSPSRSSRYPTSPISRALDLWYLPSLIVLMSVFYPSSIRRDFFHSRKSCSMLGSWFLDTFASRFSPVSLCSPHRSCSSLDLHSPLSCDRCYGQHRNTGTTIPSDYLGSSSRILCFENLVQTCVPNPLWTARTPPDHVAQVGFPLFS